VVAGVSAVCAVVACVVLLVALLTGSTASAAALGYAVVRPDAHGLPPPAAGGEGGRWTWPLTPQPAVVRRFEPPVLRWASGHRGVDLAGTPDLPVRAAGDGVVTYAGRLAGRGVVTVTHGALRTTYEPVSASVRLGDQVRAGGEIGTLEQAGSHCAPAACLHWGLLRAEVYLDPLALMRRGPSRLLPVWGVPEPPDGTVVAAGPGGAAAGAPAAVGSGVRADPRPEEARRGWGEGAVPIAAAIGAAAATGLVAARRGTPPLGRTSESRWRPPG